MAHTPIDEKDMQKRFSDLYREKQNDLRNCVRYLLSKQDHLHLTNDRIEEVVQETFLFAWERRKELFEKDNPGGWLYAILEYKIKDMLKDDLKWKKSIEAYEGSFLAFRNDVSNTLPLDIRSALKKEEDYQLLCLLYIEGYSYWEICEKLHITKSALASRIHKIKKKLREFLK